MLLNGWKRAAACALFAAGFPWDGASGQDIGAARGSGENESGRAQFAAFDLNGLSATPRFLAGPDASELVPENQKPQNVVLVPLPAPFWAATSGLTSLVLIVVWRRHRLRAE